MIENLKLLKINKAGRILQQDHNILPLKLKHTRKYFFPQTSCPCSPRYHLVIANWGSGGILCPMPERLLGVMGGGRQSPGFPWI